MTPRQSFEKALLGEEADGRRPDEWLGPEGHVHFPYETRKSRGLFLVGAPGLVGWLLFATFVAGLVIGSGVTLLRTRKGR